MLKIRLQRTGRRNDPAFRAVVTEGTRGPKSGRHVEVVGHYHPGQDGTELKAERMKYWMGKGAQVSDTLWNLLIAKGITEGKKRDALPRKNSFKKEDLPAQAGGATAPASAAPAASPESEVTAGAKPATNEGSDEAGEAKPEEPAAA